jgi:hypothetical protein
MQIFTAQQKADLMNIWHVAKCLKNTRHQRLLYTLEHYMLLNPNDNKGQVYLYLADTLIN